MTIYVAFNPNSIKNAVTHDNHHNHHNTTNWTNITNGTVIPTPTYAPIIPTAFYPSQKPTMYYNDNDNKELCHQVGDFKFSFKQHNHDGWLLCNGSIYQITKYTQLYQEIQRLIGKNNGSVAYNSSLYFQIPHASEITIVGNADLYNGYKYRRANTVCGFNCSNNFTKGSGTLTDNTYFLKATMDKEITANAMTQFFAKLFIYSGTD